MSNYPLPNKVYLLLTGILRSLRRSMQEARFDYYRREMWKTGVKIDPSAVISGIDGIKIGKGTCVYRDTIISAGNIPFIGSFDTPPKGSIKFGERCYVMPGAIIATYGGEITIGDDVSLNPYVILYGHGNLRIGNKTRIAAQTVIIPANHIYADPLRPIMEQGMSCKGITIGSDVWIGTGVRILDGVNICNGAIIGAGSVVTKDVAPNSIAVGTPARAIAMRGGETKSAHK